ncbi:hypothetical protein NQ317_006440 [Molorchus minor]|uniref:Uncharacterized protein n=1 Tax=Molorchus minor TaxID=1323400 RepID=A0ABQ9IRJ5_9CUCU|nr:hypothetical protein NQ317_006440 [Molorchus minor]
MDVTQFEVTRTPPTVYYIPDFITEAEETSIINNVHNVPKPKWTVLSNRRLQDYGGVPHEKGMIPEKIPNWLQPYINKVAELNIFGGKTPNQILINEYLPGRAALRHVGTPGTFRPLSTKLRNSDSDSDTILI